MPLRQRTTPRVPAGKFATGLLLFCSLLLAHSWTSGQSLVTEIKLRTDPAEARVRPYENLVIQVLAYGELTEDEETKKVRLREGDAKVEIKEEKGGWLSKPFRYQGDEIEPFYEEEDAGLGSLIFGRASRQFVLKDAFLYTAPLQPGRYRIEAELSGKTASIIIEVDSKAPSRRPREKVGFPAERPSTDPYRALAEHYAPFIAQETWFQPKSDYLARFDLDGDWRGDNNWVNAEMGSSQAYVHYAVMETDTHWFLIYNLFHPRDYSDNCVVGTCHENDNEGLILTVERDGSTHGRLLIMETLAHNNIYSYRADRRVKKNVHKPDGDVEFYQASHPVVFVESGGHGIYGSDDGHAGFSLKKDEFQAGTGVTYIYKGVAERPRHGNDRNIGYNLLPIYDYWWQRAHAGDGKGRSFDAYYVYKPYGDRPRPAEGEIAGSFLGRKFGSNKAKPFWGWHDKRTQKKKVLATGQWALDPAFGVSRNLRLPGPVSLDYTFHPFLGIGSPSPRRVTHGTGPVGDPSDSAFPAGLDQFRVRQSSRDKPGSKKGRFDLRLVVDGEAIFFIHGDTVRYQVVSGWSPKDDGSECSHPIPKGGFRKFKVQKKDGRGKVTLLEEPSPRNDFTAKMRIYDRKGGDDRYHVRIEWERIEEQASGPPGTRVESTILSKHLGLIRERE